jgi:uncharacterized protein
MEAEKVTLQPVAARERIEVLDLMRGLAILGILFMNIPIMANSVWVWENDVRLSGWTQADQVVWAFNHIFLDGTQRGLLQLLFGAGMMLLAARAMTPDGPVAVSDMYQRRNMWLVLFGVLHATLFLWAGDILFIYGITALLIFPFRVVAPKKLMILGAAFATLVLVGGGFQYVQRGNLQRDMVSIEAKVEKGQALTKDEKAQQKEWKEVLDRRTIDKKEQKKLDDEKKWRTGNFGEYVGGAIGLWVEFLGKGMLIGGMIESFFTMMIGIALFKWGIIQGQRDKAFYLKLLIACYAFGLAARSIGAFERMAFNVDPKTGWFTQEYARLAMSIGHIALVNWLAKTRAGVALLAPFKATGKTALSLYILQSVITMWILFAPFGFGLWGKYSYADQALIALAIIVGQVILANIWVRYFAMGPVEWLWRSLAHWRRQPFRLAAKAD